MQYVLINLNGSPAYQEVWQGVVQRFTDLDGNTVSGEGSSSVVDSNPTPPAWALPDPQADQAAQPTPRTLTKLEYLRRFTQEERVAIRTAAKSNAQLEDYLALLELAEFINLDDPDTFGALNLLESVGLLTLGRAQEIINA